MAFGLIPAYHQSMLVGILDLWACVWQFAVPEQLGLLGRELDHDPQRLLVYHLEWQNLGIRD